MTARKILVPTSQIQTEVGMFSARVASSVPVLSKDSRLVPDFALDSLLIVVAITGGHIACFASTNSRCKSPF